MCLNIRRFAAIFISAMGACTVSQAQTATEFVELLGSAEQARIDAIANEWIESGHSAGLAIAIVRNNRLVLAKGYGYADIEAREPVTARTVFRVGSLTKQFTAASILLLAEQGKLSVNDRVSKYYADFPQGSEVTIRELLTHTSGVHDIVEDLLADPKLFPEFRLDRTKAELLQRIETRNPAYDFQPGTGWHYSNSGYILAGLILERVAGQPFGKFLQQNIAGPLQLGNTAVDDNDTLVAHRAQGYDAIPDQPGEFVHSQFWSLTGAEWSGSMRSTVGDLVRWHHALFAGHILEPAQVQQMITPAKLLDGRPTSEGLVPPQQTEPMSVGGYGYGLNIADLDGHRQIGHDGNVFGFSAQLNTYPDDHLTVAILSNTSGGLEGPEGPVWKAITRIALAARR
jgi:D-alanyl-D-alanine carboxypeptidase